MHVLIAECFVPPTLSLSGIFERSIWQPAHFPSPFFCPPLPPFIFFSFYFFSSPLFSSPYFSHLISFSREEEKEKEEKILFLLLFLLPFLLLSFSASPSPPPLHSSTTSYSSSSSSCLSSWAQICEMLIVIWLMIVVFVIIVLNLCLELISGIETRSLSYARMNGRRRRSERNRRPLQIGRRQTLPQPTQDKRGLPMMLTSTDLKTFREDNRETEHLHGFKEVGVEEVIQLHLRPSSPFSWFFLI